MVSTAGSLGPDPTLAGGGCAPAGCLCAVQGFGGAGGGRIVRGRPLGVCAPCGGGGRLGRFLLSGSGLGLGVVGFGGPLWVVA